MSDELAAEGPGAATRRTLLLGAGAVGAGVVLAGCGTDSADDGNGAAPDTQTGSTPTPDGHTEGDEHSEEEHDDEKNLGAPGTKLAAAADVPVGGGLIFAMAGVVVTQPTEGTFKGFSSACTHQGCPVSEVADGTINCNCHNSKFSVADGSVKGGPANQPLAEKAVKKEGDDIVLA